MELASLVHRYFPSPSAELQVEGAGIRDIATSYTTPLFVYSQRVLQAKLDLLRQTLPPRFSVYYSLKANPNLSILRFFVRSGCGLEIASAGEYCQARTAGCVAGRILFAGPGKTDTEIELVLKEGIGELHAESLGEIARIQAIAARFGVRAPVALRVNPTADAQGGAMRMGGKPAAFGVDEEIVPQALELIARSPAIEFRGIHLFSGTQILDKDILLKQYEKTVQIARYVMHSGMPVATVDFGGGLGIPYFAHEEPLDMDGFRVGLQALFADVSSDSGLRQTTFIVEPGRFLVGEAGIYVTRVLDVKVSRGKKFVITDGGMNHHLAASGNLGQTIKRNYPIACVNKLTADAVEEVEIAGPLCTPLDVLGRAVRMPLLEPGDLIGIFQSGAYARAASPLNFLSHPAPAEVMVEDGRTHLIRRCGNPADCLQDQNAASAG